MTEDGSGVAPLTHGAREFSQPSWSPNGKSIAFVGYPRSVPLIEVANADGTGMHRVSPPPWISFNPAWTPRGKIVFLGYKDAGISAYIVNPDGTGMRKLYPNLTSVVQSIQVAWGSTALPPAAC